MHADVCFVCCVCPPALDFDEMSKAFRDLGFKIDDKKLSALISEAGKGEARGASSMLQLCCSSVAAQACKRRVSRAARKREASSIKGLGIRLDAAFSSVFYQRAATEHATQRRYCNRDCNIEKVQVFVLSSVEGVLLMALQLRQVGGGWAGKEGGRQ